MMQGNGAIQLDLNDGEKRGIPRLDLEAIKTFLASMRSKKKASGTTQEETRISKLKMSGVPEAQRKEVIEFVERINKIRFFQADDNPKPEWRVFYGKTWQEAYEKTQANVSAFSQMLNSGKNAVALVENSFVPLGSMK